MKAEPLNLLRFAFALVLASLGRASVVSIGQVGTNANLLVGSANTFAAGVLTYGGNGTALSGNNAGKVLLLDRGGNTFADKATAAMNAGAIALIIADNVDEANFAGQLLPAGTTSPIPILLVSKTDGATLKTKAGAIVTVGPNFTPPALILGNLSIAVMESSSGSAKPGTPVVLVAATFGAPPYTFQWAKDGNAIADATGATLTLPSVSAGDAGAYTCTATNAGGSATSGPYTLAVSP